MDSVIGIAENTEHAIYVLCSLIASIKLKRPEILADTSSRSVPIPDLPPPGFFEGTSTVIIAIFLLLPRDQNS